MLPGKEHDDPYEAGYNHGVRDLLIGIIATAIVLGLIVVALSMVQQYFGV